MTRKAAELLIDSLLKRAAWCVRRGGDDRAYGQGIYHAAAFVARIEGLPELQPWAEFAPARDGTPGEEP